MQRDLLTWVQELTGDAALGDAQPYRDAVSGLDWLDAHRDYARALILETYWRPRLPPDLRAFYPGGSSQVGFLGWGDDLSTVLRTDRDLLTGLGVTAPAVGHALKHLLDCYARIVVELADTLPLDLDPLDRAEQIKQALFASGLVSHAVTARSTRGWQRCPFSTCAYARRFCPHSQLEFDLVNRNSGATIHGPGLLWHLIADHGFFEGPGSPYRVEPASLVKVLFQ